MGEVKKRKLGKYRRGELAKRILFGLAVGGIIVSAFALPNIVQVLQIFGVGSGSERQRMIRALNRLKESKLISIVNKEGRETIELTRDGEKKIRELDLENLEIPKKLKWDGDWHMVAFDIPEKRKKARTAFQLELRFLGFVEYQKSLYVYPFECQDEIDYVSEIYDVRRYVRYFKVLGLSDEYFLIKRFKLG